MSKHFTSEEPNGITGNSKKADPPSIEWKRFGVWPINLATGINENEIDKIRALSVEECTRQLELRVQVALKAELSQMEKKGVYTQSLSYAYLGSMISDIGSSKLQPAQSTLMSWCEERILSRLEKMPYPSETGSERLLELSEALKRWSSQLPMVHWLGLLYAEGFTPRDALSMYTLMKLQNDQGTRSDFHHLSELLGEECKTSENIWDLIRMKSFTKSVLYTCEARSRDKVEELLYKKNKDAKNMSTISTKEPHPDWSERGFGSELLEQIGMILNQMWYPFVSRGNAKDLKNPWSYFDRENFTEHIQKSKLPMTHFSMQKWRTEFLDANKPHLWQCCEWLLVMAFVRAEGMKLIPSTKTVGLTEAFGALVLNTDRVVNGMPLVKGSPQEAQSYFEKSVLESSLSESAVPTVSSEWPTGNVPRKPRI